MGKKLTGFTDTFGRKVDAREFERFIALAKELGLGSPDLAGRVGQLLAGIAYQVNRGLEEQAAFLVNEEGDWEASLRLLTRLKKPAAPAAKQEVHHGEEEG